MAKPPNGKGGTARFRFVLLEGEFPEGDLSEVTQAIQNALKPQTQIIQQRVVSTPVQNPSISDGRGEIIDAEEALPADAEIESSKPASRSTRTTKPRTFRSPEVLDLDLTSEPSWRDYATEKSPKAEVEKNLVVAAWFKEHRGVDAITADHVYTCYRYMNWSTSAEDFGATLRACKGRKFMNSAGTGEYAINHLGIDRVNNLGRD
jgi:hypothetical protein